MHMYHENLACKAACLTTGRQSDDDCPVLVRSVETPGVMGALERNEAAKSRDGKLSGRSTVVVGKSLARAVSQPMYLNPLLLALSGVVGT